jgi:hypothetical protein
MRGATPPLHTSSWSGIQLRAGSNLPSLLILYQLGKRARIFKILF